VCGEPGEKWGGRRKQRGGDCGSTARTVRACDEVSGRQQGLSSVYLSEGRRPILRSIGKATAGSGYDGTWWLRPIPSCRPRVAPAIKKFWLLDTVPRLHRLLEPGTRPIYHQRDPQSGSCLLFVSRALLLRHELQHVYSTGHALEWAAGTWIWKGASTGSWSSRGKRFCLRSDLPGTAGRVVPGRRVAAPPTVRTRVAHMVSFWHAAIPGATHRVKSLTTCEHKQFAAIVGCPKDQRDE